MKKLLLQLLLAFCSTSPLLANKGEFASVTKGNGAPVLIYKFVFETKTILGSYAPVAPAYRIPEDAWIEMEAIGGPDEPVWEKDFKPISNSYAFEINGRVLRILSAKEDIHSGSYSVKGLENVESIQIVVDRRQYSDMINSSCRGYVRGTKNPLITGFYLGSDQRREVLIRAIGPGLSQFGVQDFLKKYTLKLFDDKGNLVAGGYKNDLSVINTLQVYPAAGAFALPLSSDDQILFIKLAPGAYTVQVSGLDENSSGEVLAEVYTLPYRSGLTD